ncbi:MAG: 3'-5' exonuclease [Prevotellaceae bacterium]|nr:3'-5' exonuclease [Prevotellaceae bacterium]
MKKIIYDKIDKAKIAEMKRVVFPGRIFVITTEGEARRAIDYLMTFKLVGVDTETRPSFQKRKTNKVALLQVSTENECFLFRLNRLGITPDIKRFLESDVIKVGASLHDDIHVMITRQKFAPKNFVDIQKIVEQLGVKDKALRKLYANFFGMNISKTQQLTNWEADILTDAQKQYAAIDAWSCIKLYNEITRLIATQDYELVETVSLTDNV